MKSRMFLLLLATFCTIGLPVAGQQRATDAEIHAAIAQLNNDSIDSSLKTFYTSPYRSTELLISDLSLTHRGRYHNHPHAVWVIRALRSLTGQDFRAPTRADLTEDEAHFLDHDPNTDDVLFFGTWMSRHTVWIAPHDAQIAIIKKWRRWFVQYGKGLKYVNDPVADHWYF
jgi:hypothetical protein